MSKGRGVRYHCDYCRADITSKISIKCAVCQDFDLCLNCFSMGVEVVPHRNFHDYHVVDHVTVPIFDPTWGADQEMLMLEGIEMYGIGNWSDAADHVGTKSRVECEKHYYDIYLSGPTAPLPDTSTPLPIKQQILSADTGPRSEGSIKKSRANSRTKSKKPKNPALAHLVGYLPRRGDFETEYADNAEEMIADMEFRDADTAWEKELKLKVLEIYNTKLDARIERKRFILERGLLDKKLEKRTKSERETYDNMRVFARFHGAEDHEALITGIINEQRLRKRIEQLQDYRLDGILTLADAEIYEKKKKKREQQHKSQKDGLFDRSKPGKRNHRDTETESARVVKLRRAGSEHMPGLPYGQEHTQQLTEQERLLCKELDLTAQHFVTIKERIIKECYVRGFLKPGTARQLLKIDINKTDKIFDFFVSVGWLSAVPASSRSEAMRSGVLPSMSYSPSVRASRPQQGAHAAQLRYAQQARSSHGYPGITSPSSTPSSSSSSSSSSLSTSASPSLPPSSASSSAAAAILAGYSAARYGSSAEKFFSQPPNAKSPRASDQPYYWLKELSNYTKLAVAAEEKKRAASSSFSSPPPERKLARAETKGSPHDLPLRLKSGSPSISLPLQFQQLQQLHQLQHIKQLQELQKLSQLSPFNIS